MKKILSITVLGFLSGLLVSLGLKTALLFLLPGLLFGIVLAIFFVYIDGKKSFLYMTGFIGFSILGYSVAVAVTELITLLSAPKDFPWFGSSQSIPVSGLALISGGFIGTYILISACSFLYKIKNTQVVILSCVGAIFALFGTMFDPLSSPFFVIVWQTGVALALGIIVSIFPEVESSVVEESVARKNEKKVVAVIGTIIGIGISGFQLIGPIQDFYTQNKNNQIIDKQYGAKPSLVNVPFVTSMDPTLVMIDHPIGSYFSLVASGPDIEMPAQPGSTMITAPVQRILYSEGYSATSTDVGAHVPDPAVIVIVTEYPTSKWAKYELRDTPDFDYIIHYPGTEKLVKLFDSNIYVIKDGNVYFWVSGNKTITIRSYTGYDSMELIKEYLLKYPSAL